MKNFLPKCAANPVLLMPHEVTADGLNALEEALAQGLDEAMAATGVISMPVQPFGFEVRDATGQFIGGVKGEIKNNWAYVAKLWVAPAARNQQAGTKLMARVEALAKQHDLQGICLNTYTFQAPDFYQRLGYRIFGQLQNYPEGHNRIYLAKELK